jgi:putative ABC transport system substrate-binding protein
MKAAIRALSALLFPFCSLLLAPRSSAWAQQPAKVFRIGFLDNSSASGNAPFLEAFRKEMRKLGWIEGKNITIETPKD